MILLGYEFTLGWIGTPNLNFSTTHIHIIRFFPSTSNFRLLRHKNTLDYLSGESCISISPYLITHSLHQPITHSSTRPTTRIPSNACIKILVTAALAIAADLRRASSKFATRN